MENDIDALQRLEHRGAWDENSVMIAAACACADTLLFLLEVGAPVTGCAVAAAASGLFVYRASLINDEMVTIERRHRRDEDEESRRIMTSSLVHRCTSEYVGWRPAACAAYRHLDTIVLDLVDYDLNSLDWRVLRMAAKGDNLSLCTQLIVAARTADHIHDNGYMDTRILLPAAGRGHTATVLALHALGIPWDTRVTWAAASRGQLDTLRALLRDLCPVDDDAAIAACWGGHPECLTQLLEGGHVTEAKVVNRFLTVGIRKMYGTAAQKRGRARCRQLLRVCIQSSNKTSALS